MGRLVYGAVLAIACLGFSTSSALADLLLGVNFQGRNDDNSGNNNKNALAAGASAGLVAQSNWNNDPTQVGSAGTHSINRLMDSTGTTTSVALTVTANDSWSSGSNTSDANHTLLNGIIKAAFNANQTNTYAFANLTPNGIYKLIAYTMENGTGGTANLTAGGITYFTMAQNGPDFNGTFVRASNTNVTGTPDLGNYVEFDNITADAFGNLTLTEVYRGGSDGFGIAGLQVQGAALVPEPCSAVLFGLGTIALAGMAWRRRTA